MHTILKHKAKFHFVFFFGIDLCVPACFLSAITCHIKIKIKINREFKKINLLIQAQHFS